MEPVGSPPGNNLAQLMEAQSRHETEHQRQLTLFEAQYNLISGRPLTERQVEVLREWASQNPEQGQYFLNLLAHRGYSQQTSAGSGGQPIPSMTSPAVPALAEPQQDAIEVPQATSHGTALQQLDVWMQLGR